MLGDGGEGRAVSLMAMQCLMATAQMTAAGQDLAAGLGPRPPEGRVGEAPTC